MMCAYVERLDTQRNAFLERYFHHDVTDSEVHDLVINTEQLGIDGATETLMSGFHLWLNNWVSKRHCLEA